MATGDVTCNINNLYSKKGAIFDGNDDKIVITNNESLETNGDITIAAWIKRGAAGTKDPILVKDHRAEYMFRIDSDDQPFIYQGNGGSEFEGLDCTNSSTQIGTKWTHVAVTRETTNKEVKFYVNGEKEGDTINYSIEVGTSTANVKIGTREPVFQQFMYGTIADVRLYKKKLTETEIKDLYNGNIKDKIVSKWDLKEDYKDSIGSNDGTNSGTYLSVVEENISSSIAEARTSPNDRINIVALGNSGKILNINIEE